jgi:glycerophosphoryl diester phosphodiesterase
LTRRFDPENRAMFLLQRFWLKTLHGCLFSTALCCIGCGAPEHGPFDDSWTSHRHVAHALGAIRGQTYTNSLEAFENAYEVGFRVMEVDLQFTSDGHLVAAHDWQTFHGRAPTLSDWLEHMESLDLTGLTAGDLVELLVRHPDMYLILDPKKDVKEALRVLVELTPSANRSQLIPQSYQVNPRGVLKVYPFRSLLITIYRTWATSAQILFSVRRNSIGVVTIPDNRADPEFVRRLREAGARVYVHTINDHERWEQLESMGVHGIYTDSILPSRPDTM